MVLGRHIKERRTHVGGSGQGARQTSRGQKTILHCSAPQAHSIPWGHQTPLDSLLFFSSSGVCYSVSCKSIIFGYLCNNMYHFFLPSSHRERSLLAKEQKSTSHVKFLVDI